jgi:restriction system protein
VTPNHSNLTSLITAHATIQHQAAHTIAVQATNFHWATSRIAPLLTSSPAVLLQAVVVPGDKTTEGQIIEAVTLPWFTIIELMKRDPNIIYQFDWRQWEEIIAGAYKQQGFDVVLTPRSNDKGRDIIATSKGFGCIRYFDQVKAFGPGHLVTANDVRAMMGVLTIEGNVSKGIITTTSDFAPGIMADPDIKRFMPYRLELKPRDALLDWLCSIASREPREAPINDKP